MHRRALIPWVKASAVFCAVCAVLALFPGSIRYIVGALCLVFGLLACVMLPVGYVTARRMDRAVTAMELNPWLHWQYSLEAWTAWSSTLVERLKADPAAFAFRRDWQKLAYLCGFMLLASCAIGYANGALLVWLGWALGCCGMLLALIEVAVADARRAPRRLSMRLSKAPREAYFGQAGLICNDQFFRWLEQDMYLTSASIDAGPPRSILFCFDRILPNGYGSAGPIHIKQSVLIPATAEPSDLARLQVALSARCPTATVALAGAVPTPRPSSPKYRHAPGSSAGSRYGCAIGPATWRWFRIAPAIGRA